MSTSTSGSSDAGDARGIYSIGALSRMLDVAPTTLRSWEGRYGLVVPERSAGAQRLYSRDHLEQLQFVCAQIAAGLSAADAHRALAERLDAGGGPPPIADTDRRILLVERDRYAAQLAEYFLRTEGYAVDTARSHAEAERTASEVQLDLVIVDLMIDGGAGLGLCRRLASSTQVLAVSALDQQDRALEAGAEAFLSKPFDALTLVSTARDLLGTSAILRAPAPQAVH
jgi:CheY-like chemotaxis protein